MVSVCEYLERFSITKPLFVPEYLAAKAINEMIGSTQRFNHQHASKVCDIVNEVENAEHYDGSGWFDYKIRLRRWLELNGFTI